MTRPVARQDSSPDLALVNQIIRSEHLQDTLCVAKDPKRLQADSEDSDQHARIFAGRICSLVGNAVPCHGYRAP